MIKPDLGPIDGTRMALPGIRMKNRGFAPLSLLERCRPDLKERLFGLTNSEGNHGEDVKEYYFYLDGTPTLSYMKYSYEIAASLSILRTRGG